MHNLTAQCFKSNSSIKMDFGFSDKWLNLLLSITGSTGCGSPFLKNARAYNSPVLNYQIINRQNTNNIEEVIPFSSNCNLRIYFPFHRNPSMFLPVFLSSSLIMHSSPLLTTFSVPSQAHLLTFHSSALKWTSDNKIFILHKCK